MDGEPQEEPEVSPGGSRVYRHRARERDLEYAGAGDPDRIGDVEAHIERYVGPVETVFHEIVSDLVHLDVAMVPAGPGRPFQTWVTMGMSERPMRVPEEVRLTGVPERAELAVLVPPDWSVDDPDAYWPMGMLKQVARLPHEYETWLGYWHTVPNGDPPAPFARGTALAGVLVAPFLHLAPEFADLTRPDGEQVRFMSLVFVTADELALKLQQGTDALIDALDAAKVDELLAPGRASVVGAGRRRPFWRRGR